MVVAAASIGSGAAPATGGNPVGGMCTVAANFCLDIRVKQQLDKLVGRGDTLIDKNLPFETG